MSNYIVKNKVFDVIKVDKLNKIRYCEYYKRQYGKDL